MEAVVAFDVADVEATAEAPYFCVHEANIKMLYIAELAAGIVRASI